MSTTRSDGLPPTDGASAWWALAVFVIASVVSYVDRVAVSLLIDPIRGELGLSEVQMGLLQGTAFSVLYAIAGLPLGRWADRHSRRNLLLFGVTLWSAATAIGGIVASAEWLFVSRVLVGVGEASLVPAAISMIADLHSPAKRGRAVTVFMMGQSLGGGAAIAFVGYVLGFVAAGGLTSVPMLGDLSPWRVVLILCGGLGLLVVALICTLSEPIRRGVVLRAASADLERRAAIDYIATRRRLFASLYVGYALISLGSYGLIAWTPSLLLRRFALSAAEAGVRFGTATALGHFCGVFAGGLVLDWLQRRGRGSQKLAAARWSTLCCLPATFVAFAPTASAAVWLLSFWFAAASMTGTLLFTANLDLYPNNLRGTATALNSLLSTLVGASLGPLLIAVVTERILGDPRSIGVSISAVLGPSLLLGVALIAYASRTLRLRLHTDDELRLIMGIESPTSVDKLITPAVTGVATPNGVRS